MAVLLAFAPPPPAQPGRHRYSAAAFKQSYTWSEVRAAGRKFPLGPTDVWSAPQQIDRLFRADRFRSPGIFPDFRSSRPTAPEYVPSSNAIRAWARAIAAISSGSLAWSIASAAILPEEIELYV